MRLAASDPYRPDLVADGGSAFGLTVRAASVRGLSKRYAGQPRQDDLCLALHGDTQTLIAAVADGVSAAPRSHLGAALAVRYAATAVIRQLDAGATDLDWDKVFAHAAWALVYEHRRASDKLDAEVQEAAAELATTLVVGAIAGGTPSPVQLAGIGDSPAATVTDGAFAFMAAESESADGMLGDAIEALPIACQPAWTATCELESEQALLLCTDGLALPLAGGHGEVAETFARELSDPPGIVDFVRLLDFSRSTYDDDRTLVAIWAR